ncbi:MAG: hypothetical protein IJL32_05995 [Oscillospiraceae bacterium]|nr:hypothetical protein [Oscillospiraceae bacterium]
MDDMTNQQKQMLCLEIMEKLKAQIKNKDAVRDIGEAIRLCRKWLDTRADVSYELYHLLDGEAHGFTLFQEAETDSRMTAVWNVLIDAAAYICRAVYEGHGAKYFPEPIELVDEETFLRCVKTYEEVTAGRAADESI